MSSRIKPSDLKRGLNYNEEACEVDSERCAAIQALIEGDASWTEILWFQTHATRSDYLDLMQVYEGFDSPIFNDAPPYIQLDLLFPYDKGFAFVEHTFTNRAVLQRLTLLTLIRRYQLSRSFIPIATPGTCLR
jgi:hypothetical protein